MDLEKLAFELDNLNMVQPDENETTNDAGTWLFDSAVNDNNVNIKEEEENLEKWLKGAVEKVDFRTRTALSRRLDKKKRKVDKEKRRKNRDSSLPRIEEMSGESGPLSDREQHHSRLKDRQFMVTRKAISEASFDSNDEDDDDDNVDDEEEEYFDAPSTPKKMPLVGRNQAVLQQSRARINANITQQHTPKSSAKNLLTYKSSTPKTNTKGFTNHTTSKRLNFGEDEAETEVPKEWRNLNDIERRAKEQERELEIELMKARRVRLSAGERSIATTTPRSRPNSASSNSSLQSGSGTNMRHQVHQNNTTTTTTATTALSASRSVDFHHPTTTTTTTNVAQNNTDRLDHLESRSNEGSLADLSSTSSCDQFNQQLQLNLRLPLPRRPTIPGKTGIPLPAPKKLSAHKITADQRKIITTSNSSPPADPAPINDEECF